MRECVLEITSLSNDGRGIGRCGGLAVFVAGALPGQAVRAGIFREKKRYAEAVILEVLESPPEMLLPECPHSGICGGCPLQAMPYAQQCFWKERLVRDALCRIGRLSAPVVHPVIPSPLLWEYRNKMEFAFGAGEAGELVLGLRERGGRRVVRVPECKLMPSFCLDIVSRACELAAASALPAFVVGEGRRAGGRRAGAGFWRFLVLRRGFREDGEEGIWIQCLTSAAGSEEQRAVAHLAERLLAEFPLVCGIVHDVRLQCDSFTQAERRQATYGVASLCQRLGGKDFVLDAASFFQVNTAGAECLWEAIHAFALEDNVGDAASTCASEHGVRWDAVWDLYCGVGAPGLLLAEKAGTLFGVEYDAAAVAMARHNAAQHGYAHGHFFAGDTGRILRTLATRHGVSRPDLVLLDPPRAGVDADVIRHLCACGAVRILYISCNPVTLARDVALLGERYVLRSVQPVDLFPHTPHIECVALLEAC